MVGSLDGRHAEAGEVVGHLAAGGLEGERLGDLVVVALAACSAPADELANTVAGQLPDLTSQGLTSFECGSGDARIDVGVVVDAVNAVLEIAASEIEPPPRLGNSIRAEYVAGMAKVAGKLMVLLDIEQVLSFETLNELKALPA